MIKIYTLKIIFVVSIILYFPISLFSQLAVMGFADSNAHVNQGNLTSFPLNPQIERLTHVIPADIGCEDDGTLFTGKLPDFWQGTPPPLNI